MSSNKYKAVFTLSAKNDLEEIYSYINETLCAPKAADDLLELFENGVKQVCSYPHSAGLLNDERFKQRGYRKLVIKNYILFYVAGEEENIIYIMRILFVGRDYSKLL